MREEPDVIADVRYAEGDERLVIAVDGSLSHREVATAVLTDIVATSQDAAAMLDGIRDVAESMAWSVRIESDGEDEVLTVS